jgi:DNA-binding SARP family transcriptional activator
LLEFRILGPLEVADERGRIDLGGPRQRATLALLLLDANRVVSVDRLADDLYAGAPPVTALKQVQRQISELRKALGSPSVIETRSPGYAIQLDPAQLDLSVFERLAAEASEAQDAGDAGCAADLLRRALDLWRGGALADLAYEPFVQAPIERLEEIRLAVLEQRIAADLELGRHAQLVPELEQLVHEHPLREGLRAQLMLALYGSGRQAEALEVYRLSREALVEAFGIEPGAALRQLERQILEQDPSLEPRGSPPAREPERALLAVPHHDAGLARLLALAEPVAQRPGTDLIVARLVADERDLAGALASLERGRDAGTRIAAFTSADPPADVVRLATAYDVEVVLLDASAETLSQALSRILEQSPADVAIVSGTPVAWAEGEGIFVPFGGVEHDWAALELAAYLAASAGASLRLVGARGDPARGRRDASRLLANASLAVQRLVDVNAEPLLVDVSPEALVESVAAATLAVVGLSPRWRTEGIGAVRSRLLQAGRPLVLVHGGPRPSGLAPRDARTRFSWSLAT